MARWAGPMPPDRRSGWPPSWRKSDDRPAESECAAPTGRQARMIDRMMERPAERRDRRGPIGRMLALWFGIALWKRILGALVLGAILGLAWGEGATSIHWIGELFVRLIRMLVVPLVFLTISSGVAALADPRRLGSIGIKTLAMYVFTTALAVTTRSEEHTSELQSLMRISYAVFCLKKKKTTQDNEIHIMYHR